MRCCCNDDDAPSTGVTTPSASPSPMPPKSTLAAWLLSIVGFIQWMLPITTLVFIPKCPACIAAYVLLFTGIGLSIPVAATMRWTLIALSIAAITFLLLRSLRRIITRPA